MGGGRHRRAGDYEENSARRIGRRRGRRRAHFAQNRAPNLQTTKGQKANAQRLGRGHGRNAQSRDRLAIGSRLDASELKQIWETAKAKVAKMDFSLYERKKKRKQKWDDLAALEKKQKKREGDEQSEHAQMLDHDASTSTSSTASSSSEPELKAEENENEFKGLFREETTEESFTLDESLRF